jgi:hypothetical protein
MQKKAASTLASFKICKTCGVPSDTGPSSKVMAIILSVVFAAQYIGIKKPELTK